MWGRERRWGDAHGESKRERLGSRLGVGHCECGLVVQGGKQPSVPVNQPRHGRSAALCQLGRGSAGLCMHGAAPGAREPPPLEARLLFSRRRPL